MLVLSRKVGQEVLIDGGRIRIKFIRHGSGGTVKLGFDAPPEVRIDRVESSRVSGHNEDGEVQNANEGR